MQNYKAFEQISIPIKPLTLLLGANSVGKSSVIQMLMLLHQTAEERMGMYSSALKIYGNYVNVGDFKNLFRDKASSKPMGLTIEMESREIEQKFKNSKRDFINKFTWAASFINFSTHDVQESKEIENRDAFLEYINNFADTLNKKSSNDGDSLFSFFLHRFDVDLDLTKTKFLDEIMRCYDLLENLSNIASSKYAVTFWFVEEANRLKISNASVFVGDDNILLFEIENKTEKNRKVSSYLPLSYQDIEFFSDIVNLDNTIFDLFINDSHENEAEPTLVSDFLFKILNRIMCDLKQGFHGETVNYCSPLRAHPKRYYMLDKAKMTISLDTLDGDAIAEVMKENARVKKSVNQWLEKFGFKVDVKEFKEVIHHMNVTQNGLTLDITDVGFGISQVLPIIIQGFLAEEKSITIIEQPEIHLHPKMQADLGDLFIEIVKSEEKKLVIETHSEYLLRRIRRRISEGHIKSSDVAICLFHAKTKETPAWVESLSIGEKGSFVWPEEFYGGELYNDTLEFLKNQG